MGNTRHPFHEYIPFAERPDARAILRQMEVMIEGDPTRLVCPQQRADSTTPDDLMYGIMELGTGCN